MISRSTDVRSALRSRQRGFIIDPYRFGTSATDPNFSSRKLLMHMNGTDGSTAYPDVIGHTVTSASTIRTAQSVFGGASGEFLGTGTNTNPTGTYVYTTSADYIPGSGDWMVEFRVRLTALPAVVAVLVDGRPNITSGAYPDITVDSGGVITYYVDSATRITGSTLATATWYAVALSKVSGSTRLFVDGTQVGSTYTDSFNYANSRLMLGASGWHSDAPGFGQYGLNGYLDELRLTIGTADCYTANYTPATSAFPDS